LGKEQRMNLRRLILLVLVQDLSGAREADNNNPRAGTGAL
jgi:hypothetical protein